MNGVIFGGKHSYLDWGLILTSSEIGFPLVKTEVVDVVGMNGCLDFTESMGDDIFYQNRSLKFTFTVVNHIERWASLVSEIANYINGKKIKIIRDADPAFYSEGRASIHQFQSSRAVGTLVVDVDAFPYKMDIQASNEEWLWDPFCFEDGVIHTGSITVSGSKTVTLVNRRMVLSPYITCSAAMTATFEGVTVNIPANVKTEVLDIRLHEGENIVTFTGNGTVEIEYRGGSL